MEFTFSLVTADGREFHERNRTELLKLISELGVWDYEISIDRGYVQIRDDEILSLSGAEARSFVELLES